MRNILSALTCLVLLGAGCRLFQPQSHPDSLDNASAQTWRVTATFTSGPEQTFEQAPDSFHDFGKTDQGQVAVLTRVVAVSQSPNPVTYLLTARDLSRMRGASPGALMLVIYDGGIAGLSPGTKQTLEKQLFNHPYDRQEYFRLLRVEEGAALLWTRHAVKGL